MGTQVLLEEIPRNPMTYTFEAVRKRESAVETQVSLQEQPSDPPRYRVGGQHHLLHALL